MNSILYVGEHAKTYDVQWHTHEEWELVYCTGGEGAFQFESGVTVNYREGDVVVIPPKVRHMNSSSDGFTNIHMRMDAPAFHNKGAFKVADDQDGRFRFTFTQAKVFYQSDDARHELVLEALGNLIASYLLVHQSNNGYSEPVEQIRSCIMRGYTQTDFSLEKIIKELPFNYDYLRRAFKKEMGMTPHEYVTSLRMKKAESMLSAMWSLDYSVTEVAEMCGYNDPLYFSRVFRKQFGCSPTAYAKKSRGESGGNEQT